MEDLTPHILITGASSGIGAAAAEELARRGWRVTAIGRDAARLSEISLRVRGITAHQCDFRDLGQVRDLADRLNGERIDVLANNAGAVARGSTVDGYDVCMQTNHIAPFLLTHLLRPRLPDGARIINTSSMASSWGADPTPYLLRVQSNARRIAPKDDVFPHDLEGEERAFKIAQSRRRRRSASRRFPSAWLAYSTSKKANILFAAEAARRWPSLYSVSFHPGVVRTRFGTRMAKVFFKFAPGLTPPERAARQLVWLATESPEKLVNGAYYVKYRPFGPQGVATSEAAAARLWDATASMLGLPA